MRPVARPAGRGRAPGPQDSRPRRRSRHRDCQRDGAPGNPKTGPGAAIRPASARSASPHSGRSGQATQRWAATGPRPAPWPADPPRTATPNARTVSRSGQRNPSEVSPPEGTSTPRRPAARFPAGVPCPAFRPMGAGPGPAHTRPRVQPKAARATGRWPTDTTGPPQAPAGRTGKTERLETGPSRRRPRPPWPRRGAALGRAPLENCEGTRTSPMRPPAHLPGRPP